MFLQSAEYENQLASVIGLDPLITLGLATFACAGLGWLAGPFFGGAIFGVLNRRVRPQMIAVSSWVDCEEVG